MSSTEGRNGTLTLDDSIAIDRVDVLVGLVTEPTAPWLTRRLGTLSLQESSALVDDGIAHRVPLHFLDRLATAEPTPLPDELGVTATLDDARVYARRYIAHALLATADLARVELPGLVYKGPFLSRALYGRPEARLSVDVDVLSAPQHYEDWGVRLRSLGYSVVKRNRWQAKLVSEAGVAIDLHRRPCTPEIPLGWAFDPVFERASSEVRRVRVPELVDHLVLVYLDAFSDYCLGRVSVGRLLDIAVGTALLGPSERDRFQGVARALDLAPAFDMLRALANASPGDDLAARRAELLLAAQPGGRPSSRHRDATQWAGVARRQARGRSRMAHRVGGALACGASATRTMGKGVRRRVGWMVP